MGIRASQLLFISVDLFHLLTDQESESILSSLSEFDMPLLLEIYSKAIVAFSAFNLFFSIPVYLVCLLAIAVNKKKYPFNSPFFTIFIALGLMDIA